MARTLALVCLALAAAQPAHATWSIAGVDPRSREVGVAGASCIGGVEIIVGLAPGAGAVAAQAFSHLAGRERAVAQLREGVAPAGILDAIAGRGFDARLGFPSYRLRQYGVAALREEASATYTGGCNFPWAGARAGPGVAVQGNLLRGPDVVQASLAAWNGASGCWLGERLLRALEAGAAAGGDRRCSARQAALSAVLALAAADDDSAAPGLRLVVSRQPRGGAAPVALLRQTYTEWSRVHPERVRSAPECGLDAALGGGAAQPGAER